MKITKRQLKQIIKEELSKTLNEITFEMGKEYHDGTLDRKIEDAKAKLANAKTEEEKQKAQKELDSAKDTRDYITQTLYGGR